jgi:hypothetical protein
MTEDEFLAKVEWEGGVVDALEYGLRADMLKDRSSELFKLWRKLDSKWDKLKPSLAAVENYFENWEGDEGYEEDDDDLAD